MKLTYPDDVRGWLTPDEAQLLADEVEGRRTLEVGTFCGKSTIVLAQVCPLVVTADWHRGDANVGDQDSASEYLGNLRRYRLGHKVVSLLARVEDAGPLLAGGQFGCIYVDAEHYADAVEVSIRSVEHCANQSCTWVFHDYGLGDVQAVVGKWAAEHSYPVEEHDTVHGIAVVRTRKPT